MRMTISLDDQLGERVKREARGAGTSVSSYVAAAIRLSLDAPKPVVAPFRLVTVGGGTVAPDVLLDTPRALVAAEDEGRYSTASAKKRKRQP